MEYSGLLTGWASALLGGDREGDLEGPGVSRGFCARPKSVETLDARPGCYASSVFLGDLFLLGGGSAAGAVLFSFLLNLEMTCYD